MRRSVDINTAFFRLTALKFSLLYLRTYTFSGSLLVTGVIAAPTWLLLSSSLLYSRPPGIYGVTAVLLITSLLSHSYSALRHSVTSGTPSWILDFYGNNAYLGAEDKQVFNKWIKKPLGKAVVGLKIDCEGYHNEGIYLLQGDYTNSKIPFKDAVREGTNEKEIDGWLEQMRPLVKEQVVFWALGKKRLLHADFNPGNIHIGAKTSQSGTSQEVHFDYPVKKARVLDFGYPGIFKVSHKATKEQVEKWFELQWESRTSKSVEPGICRIL
ncbi:uncharacterized protein C8R40DRAFT_1169936 [Lentinula edodes]|uniref:uncharacterized protein n=1 Tax=Lentinula edodes TaxID=5353 RepID=UPI001E8E8921|nr:uncharacterized protein C8R40DRAFT_1169936 [Lentinula edodes]KAH7875802.1 hypothetical protein C8R40DRAFT_1169936 [Lentinula edodes]